MLKYISIVADMQNVCHKEQVSETDEETRCVPYTLSASRNNSMHDISFVSRWKDRMLDIRFLNFNEKVWRLTDNSYVNGMAEDREVAEVVTVHIQIFSATNFCGIVILFTCVNKIYLCVCLHMKAHT